MKLLLLSLILITGSLNAQTDPLATFRQEIFVPQKQKVQSDIDLCKSNPNKCGISNGFIKTKFDEGVYRMRAKTYIRQSEFSKKHPEIKGEALKSEMDQIYQQTQFDFFHHLYATGKTSLKPSDKLPNGYKPKAYYDVVPEEYQQLIDQHFQEMQKDAKEIQQLGFSKSIEDWEHKEAAFNEMLLDKQKKVDVKEAEVKIANVEEANTESCQKEAIRQILNLFKNDKKNILGKQFELTAIKTALLLKKDENYKGKELKSLEDYVNKQQKELSSQSNLNDLKKLYINDQRPEDIQKLESITQRIKTKRYSYYNRETRLLNSDLSAFYLLKSQPTDAGIPSFGTEDAAIAWAFDKMAAQVKDKRSVEYSKMNLSNQVNKLMDSRVAGGTDVSVAKLDKMKLEHEFEINEAIQNTLTSGLSSECLSELSLTNEDCNESLVDLKAEAFAKMMKEISSMAESETGPQKIGEYGASVKNFLGQSVSAPSHPVKAPQLYTSKWAKNLFNGNGYEKGYFKDPQKKFDLYTQINSYKLIKAERCPKQISPFTYNVYLNQKCESAKAANMKKMTTFKSSFAGIGVECIKLKELPNGQMIFDGVFDECTPEKK